MQAHLDIADRFPAAGGLAADLAISCGGGAPARISVDVDRASDAEWDALASRFADVSYDQTSAYSDAKWGNDRTSTLVVREDGRPVAAARVVLLRPPVLRAGLAYVKFGPLWRPSEGSGDLASLKLGLDALVDEYCRRRGHRLTVLSRPSPDDNDLGAQVLLEAGFRPRAPSIDPLRYFVNVGLDPDRQMKSLGQKWRYNLKKALQAGVTVELADLDDGIGTFAAMHRTMVVRKGFADRDAVAMRLRGMAASLPPALRPVVAFASKDGHKLAGAVIGRAGDVSVYLFGASRDEALQLNAGYALQWWIVNWLREQGDRWYDLGGGALEPRLEQFKRGLVGKAGRLHPMPREYDFWTGVSGRLAGELVYRARDARRLARAALGRR
jgi:hypothetical protein